jgi:aminopeptidase-like protein
MARAAQKTVVTSNGDGTQVFDWTVEEEEAFEALAAKAWKGNRIAAYAELNQFEMQYDDQENGTTTWVDAIAAIKLANPKGE